MVRAPCDAVRVLLTEIVKWPADVPTDFLPLKAWKERWTVEQCGAETTYHVEYKPGLQGSIAVEIGIPGIGAPEPPPPTTLNGRLLQAAEFGDIRLIEKLLAEGAAVKATNEHGRTPFIAAVSSGHRKAAKVLLNHGSELDAQERGGGSALYYAAATGAPEMVRMLLDAGTTVHLTLKNGADLLTHAAGSGNVETVRLLLEAGTITDSKSGKLTEPLIEAATYGLSDMVLFLLERGADPHPAALYALSHGCNSPEVARILIARGSSTVTDRTRTLLNALRRRSDEDCAELARVLLTSDLNLEQVDGDGNTALILASRGGYLQIVQSLLKKGADVTVRNREGKSALDVAGTKKMADLLQKAIKP